MDNEILIEAQALSRRYGPTMAVSELNLTLRKGDILGLLGPNGAGKTTTMKMLAGCLAPTSGAVKIKGISLAEEPKRAKAHLGYLPEQPPLYPELTVNEYLRYCAGLHGVPRAEREDAVARAKQACALNDVAQRLIGNLSKGYQQRVGLAQAIIHRPPVVILDEPTIGLDPIQIREIRALIRELGHRHSVILSSHILPEIQAVCSRVMIINKGRVVYAEALNRSAPARVESVIVGLRRAPDEAALKNIPGVRDVQTLSNGQFRLAVAPQQDPREALAEAAVKHGWGLTELRSESKSLEEIFVELTSGDAAAAETLKEAA
ncbi:MAG: ATP-binding cassette domain-containing protein [Sinobacteraceae bacterium]|nr:ATP-binding cassette domain-containing protein [Nevskia sp.]MDI3260585.1 ATP-binding cassette domain-containing protein [Nevskiaceae bacterium]